MLWKIQPNKPEDCRNWRIPIFYFRSSAGESNGSVERTRLWPALEELETTNQCGNGWVVYGDKGCKNYVWWFILNNGNAIIKSIVIWNLQDGIFNMWPPESGTPPGQVPLHGPLKLRLPRGSAHVGLFANCFSENWAPMNSHELHKHFEVHRKNPPVNKQSYGKWPIFRWFTY